MRKKIIISGYYGFDNSGDDAILKSMIDDIKFLDKDLDIVILSKNPKKTEKIYGTKSINRFNILKIIKEIKTCDLLISGGGSLLQDVTSNRSLWYYLFIMKLSDLFKKPYMVFANGIGPLNSNFNRKITKNILEKAAFITLRDEDSAIFLEKLKLENPNLKVTADPAFRLKAESLNKVRQVFEEENIPFEKELIGISVRRWNKDDALIKVLVDLIDYIEREYDKGILFIPMHHPSDLEFAKSIRNQSSGKSVYVLEGNYSPQMFMGIISQVELLIGMRLHALIYAASQGIPLLGLSYDPKVVSLMDSLDIDYLLDVDSLNSDDLILEVKKLIENKNEISEELLRKEKKLEDLAYENIELVCKLLGEN